jgi:hypothetical protein
MKTGCALLTLLAAAGCSWSNVGPDDPNPPFGWSENSYAEDGVQDARDPRVFRVCFDRRGVLAPDPGAADAVAERLNRLGKPVVLLIHGCNNTYPEARRSYLLARMLLQDRDCAFLEVYWDGGAGDPIALWGHARESSKWAGLGLRGLLRRLRPDLDARVLTHSRGAAVIASARWNLPLREADEEAFRARQSREELPDARRYRLGLLVPAMPEEDFESCPRGLLESVLLGFNTHDPALTKGPFPSTWFGSTRAGCDPDVFPSSVAPAAREARLVDLSRSTVHDFKDYLLRRAFLETLLPALMEGVPYQVSSTPALSKSP